MATISPIQRGREGRGHRTRPDFLAWILWLAVHVVYVVGFRSRLSTLMSWTWTFLGSWRGQMTVTDQQVVARNVMGKLVLLDRGEDDDDAVVARAS